MLSNLDINSIQYGPLRGYSLKSVNNETWHSYTLPKEDATNI